MSSRSRIKAAVLPALVLGAALAGCSNPDLYLDRRETIALHAGDAMASNRVTHTIDPWSPASANRNIAYNGERMQTAHERYRTGCVILPNNPTTTTTAASNGSTQGHKKEPQCASNSQAAPAPASGNKP